MSWHTQPSSSTTWRLDRSASSTRRVTQDGFVRVTEQGVIRIIERMDATWSKETSTFSPWIKE